MDGLQTAHYLSKHCIMMCLCLVFYAGLGSLELEYDANKNPAIFQQLCELQPDAVILQASINFTQQKY